MSAGASGYRIGEKYYINSEGIDIWGSSDYFGLMHRPGGDVTVEGDVYFPADLTTLPYNAKIGIMYRESLDAGSKFFAICKMFDGSIIITQRAVTNSDVRVDDRIVLPDVRKLKLSKEGTVLKAYYFDANEFKLFGTSNIDFGSGSKIGFCIAYIDTVAEAILDNVKYYSSTTVQNPTKPVNLIAKVVQIASTATEQSGGQTNNKPLNLIAKVVQIASAGDATASVGAKVPTTGFSVLSFGGKDGLFYGSGQGKVLQMKLTADVGAGTITDEAWAYNPPMWNNATNSMVTPYKAWKINETGDWKTTPLTSIDVSHYNNEPIMVTKIFYFVDVYTKCKTFQQIIQLF